MTRLKSDDLPLLRERGFHASPSGYSWFAFDKSGGVWQATEEDNGNLSFRAELDGRTWGEATPMQREMFEQLFPKKNYPRGNTGD